MQVTSQWQFSTVVIDWQRSQSCITDVVIRLLLHFCGMQTRFFDILAITALLKMIHCLAGHPGTNGELVTR
jgi:hypothetical protein